MATSEKDSHTSTPSEGKRMPLDSGSTFSKRVTASVFFIAVSLYAIFLGPRWLFILIVEALVLTALYEFFTIARRKNLELNTWLGLVFGAMLPLAYDFPGDVVIMMAAMLCIFLFNFHRRLKEQALVNTAVTMFGLVYVSWFFSYLVKIRELPHGATWVFFVILVTKSGDMAAYFMGQRFGKTKFIQHISPNKSVEGAISSFLASVAAAVLSKSYLGHVSIGHLLTLGIVLGIIAQVGDLCESLIKRDCGVKDSGRVPGLGGVLDIMDSLLFVIPFTYYYIVSFPGLLR